MKVIGSMSNNMKRGKVGVVGAGIGGIAAAIRLAIKGFQVELYEGNAYPGGKLSELKLDGYRFDKGPSLFTLPELVDDLFILAGETPEKHFTYSKLPITCKYFYADGTVINGYSEKEKFAKEINAQTGEPTTNILRALDNSKFLYEHLSPLFMYRSLHKVSTFTSRKALKAYSNLNKFDFFRTMNAANKSFFKDEKVVQLFNRYATYNGSDPFQTPATLNIIPHLELGKGAFFPKKGMNDIVLSLCGLAERVGVKFFFQRKVDRILTASQQAIGLQVGHKRLQFDKIICNMDMVNAYKRLLPDEKQPKRLLNQDKSSSALIFYWGIKSKFPALDLHNIFFSRNYKEEFDSIFHQKKVTDDPTVYLNITAKYKKDDAPQGCENWFTMINVPSNSGQDWDSMISKSRANIIQKISRILDADIEQLIQVESILDPRLIEAQTSSSQGALYGNSSNNRYAAFLRHPNFSPYIRDLYFCGGSVHPGGGIPLSLLSAKIATEMID